MARLAEETLTERRAQSRQPWSEGCSTTPSLGFSNASPPRSRTIDLAYVDGHHDDAATLHYVALLAPHLSRGGCIVLDDICLYEEMWRAWTQVSAMPGVSVAAPRRTLRHPGLG